MDAKQNTAPGATTMARTPTDHRTYHAQATAGGVLQPAADLDRAVFRTTLEFCTDMFAMRTVYRQRRAVVAECMAALGAHGTKDERAVRAALRRLARHGYLALSGPALRPYNVWGTPQVPAGAR
jgi:hypothetical protein